MRGKQSEFSQSALLWVRLRDNIVTRYRIIGFSGPRAKVQKSFFSSVCALTYVNV